MSQLPFQEGAFVWCAFPERENPAQPGPLHIGYSLAVSGVALTSPPPSALMAYTTTRQWPPDTPLPLGVLAFDHAQASIYGQFRAFVMDLRRVAFPPMTTTWFPQLDQPGSGVKGHAPKEDQRRFRRTAEDLARRHGELVERLGPLTPPPRR